LSEYCARYLQGHVTEEENPDSQTQHAIVKPKVARHSKRRECHAGSVEVVDDVKEENERKQSNDNVTACLFYRRTGNGRARA